MGNPFVHVELMSTDVPKAKAFYGELFDWQFQDMSMGDMTYTMNVREQQDLTTEIRVGQNALRAPFRRHARAVAPDPARQSAHAVMLTPRHRRSRHRITWSAWRAAFAAAS